MPARISRFANLGKERNEYEIPDLKSRDCGKGCNKKKCIDDRMRIKNGIVLGGERD
jgi:hypothetical protein